MRVRTSAYLVRAARLRNKQAFYLTVSSYWTPAPVHGCRAVVEATNQDLVTLLILWAMDPLR